MVKKSFQTFGNLKQAFDSLFHDLLTTHHKNPNPRGRKKKTIRLRNVKTKLASINQSCQQSTTTTRIARITSSFDATFFDRVRRGVPHQSFFAHNKAQSILQHTLQYKVHQHERRTTTAPANNNSLQDGMRLLCK